MRGMKHFYEALSKVKTMKRPVRIAYFGDSFIEADIFTADLREMLQQEFGGCGVGYVPVTSSISGYRPTVRHTLGDGAVIHPMTPLVLINAARYFRTLFFSS